VKSDQEQTEEPHLPCSHWLQCFQHVSQMWCKNNCRHYCHMNLLQITAEPQLILSTVASTYVLQRQNTNRRTIEIGISLHCHWCSWSWSCSCSPCNQFTSDFIATFCRLQLSPSRFSLSVRQPPCYSDRTRIVERLKLESHRSWNK